METETRGPQIEFTAFHSVNPLSKRFSLDQAGKLVKENLAQLSVGNFRKVVLKSLSQFSEFLLSLTPNDAIAYGLFEGADSGEVVSTGMKENHPDRYVTAKTRSRKDMTWPMGGGILFLDYDPPAGNVPLSKDQLVEKVREACPFLAEVEMLWRPSASSNIVHSETGEFLQEVKGQRLYINVSHANEIPRIGNQIASCLWLAGHGRFDISKAGTPLERTIVDTLVWQPERLDFAGGAVVVSPLHQPKLRGQIIPGAKKVLDCKSILPLENHLQSRLDALKIDAKRASSPHARKAKEEYVETRTKELAGDGADQEKLDKVRRTVVAALDGKILYGDFPLLHLSGEKVTVSAILDDPKKWNNTRFADPLEPEYDNNDHRIAYLNSMGGKPYLYSHAHGGRRFALKRNIALLQVEAGNKAYLTDRVIEILQEQDDLFEDSKHLLMFRITGEERFPVTSAWLNDKISRLISFERFDARQEIWLPTDVPKLIPETILAKNGERGLAELRGISTAPTITPEGRIIDKPGYDSETCILFLATEEWPTITICPTPSEIKDAFEILWKPFKDFPFTDAETRGVMLSALFTAVLRPCLPTAPAFGFDAPTAGSGKTLLARCCGILATGHEPEISPPFGDEPETKKKLFADLVKGSGAVVIDNLIGKINSPSFAAILTSEKYTDRVLGFTQNCTVANRALWVLTGNNLRPVGDLNRRILIARIDPAMEAKEVWKREFPLDPASYCLRHRLDLVRAVLTMMRGYYVTGKPKLITGRFASFDVWSDSVRQAVSWLGSTKVAPVADPLIVLNRQAELDPEASKLAMILTAWFAVFGAEPTSVSKAVDKVRGYMATGKDRPEYLTLHDAMAEIASDAKGFIIARMLGGWIEARVGKIINGLCFARAARKTDGVAWWFVRKVG